jgi:antitoxin (DNA-binding transcriptional repressor) of toxin-antitoxin stability system
MTQISIEEAQLRLSDLVRQLSPGDEVLLTENNQPVARLTKTTLPEPNRQLGSLAGTVLYMAPDFDAPLDEFQEYMP